MLRVLRFNLPGGNVWFVGSGEYSLFPFWQVDKQEFHNILKRFEKGMTVMKNITIIVKNNYKNESWDKRLQVIKQSIINRIKIECLHGQYYFDTLPHSTYRTSGK